ncbi:MAG TPA: hypothetical protein VIL04_09060 [Solirubrobacterales bacterium]|jgi:hypothetical protein
MPISTEEARAEIVAELGVAEQQLELALSCLGDAFELLAVGAAERLEDELFRPIQRAYARAKRTRAGFAERVRIPAPTPERLLTGGPSQGAKALVERAAEAAHQADRVLSELQDSMLPVEAGDGDLRSGISETREQLARVGRAASEFLRTFGR